MKKKDKPPNVNKWKWTSLSLYQNYNIIVRKVYPKRLLSTVFWLFISRAHDWNEVKLLSRVRRCGSIDYRAPGFSIMGFSRQEFLEWVAISFSRGSSRPRDQPKCPASQADALPSESPGKPYDWKQLLKKILNFIQWFCC